MSRNNALHKIRLALYYAVTHARSRHHEIKWATIGAAVGIFTGVYIGSVGIAAHGKASGLSELVVAILFAGLGALVGSRFGIGKDKKAADKDIRSDI